MRKNGNLLSIFLKNNFSSGIGFISTKNPETLMKRSQIKYRQNIEENILKYFIFCLENW